MGVPILTAIEDCADYSKTVTPFLPQLYALPNRLLENGFSIDGLKQIYLETNPLMTGFAASLFIGGLALIVSEANRNYSQIDRCWSLLPNLYVVHMALWARFSGLAHERLDLAAAATTIWSIRLTFNYWRRGGYQVGSEDYRWEIIQGKVPSFVFFLFNVTFISFYQSILLFLFGGTPAYVILLSTQFEPKIGTPDTYWFAIIVLLVFSEWVSDGQQWRYQSAKYEYRRTGKVTPGYEKADLERGFVTSGLWAYSRHPNFFAEQAIWIVLYQWSCYASNSLYGWMGIGAALLVLLFQGSTAFTESITAGKYPEYSEYQAQIGRIVPMSLGGYSAPVQQPKIIRTSEILKWQQEKETQQKEQQKK